MWIDFSLLYLAAREAALSEPMKLEPRMTMFLAVAAFSLISF